MAKVLKKTNSVGIIAYTKEGGFASPPDETAPKKYQKTTIQGIIPAIEPKMKGRQSVRSVYWLRLSIKRPKRFIMALRPNISMMAPRSQTPASMPMSTIMSEELSAYS